MHGISNNTLAQITWLVDANWLAVTQPWVLKHPGLINDTNMYTARATGTCYVHTSVADTEGVWGGNTSIHTPFYLLKLLIFLLQFVTFN